VAAGRKRGLWAEPLGGGQYRIDNTPWFVRDLAAGDIVMAADEDGVLWATERVQWSGRLTLRVIPWLEGPLRGDRRAVLDLFAPLGVTGEGVARYGIVALDVPAAADLQAVKTLLLAGDADGRWDYEEGCVSDSWLELQVTVPNVRDAAVAIPVDEPNTKLRPRTTDNDVTASARSTASAWPGTIESIPATRRHGRHFG
jgi:hypothetical protein